MQIITISIIKKLNCILSLPDNKNVGDSEGGDQQLCDRGCLWQGLHTFSLSVWMKTLAFDKFFICLYKLLYLTRFSPSFSFHLYNLSLYFCYFRQWLHLFVPLHIFCPLLTPQLQLNNVLYIFAFLPRIIYVLQEEEGCEGSRAFVR